MAAPQKKNLDYYSWYCNAYDVDIKLRKLSRKYGPLGETIFHRLLDLIYSTHYYYEASLDNMAMIIVDKIGSKWVSDDKCSEVLEFCADIGLIDKDLMQSNVFTSVGIQDRYFTVAVSLRRKVNFKENKYLLIDILLIAEQTQVNAEETIINATLTGVNATLTGVNTGKGNETKRNEIKPKLNESNSNGNGNQSTWDCSKYIQYE